eukprot:4349813-Prymnesium_polylepis.1
MGGGHCTGSKVTLRRGLGEVDSPSLLFWLLGRGRSSELVRLASSASSASLKPGVPSERSLVTWHARAGEAHVGGDLGGE